MIYGETSVLYNFPFFLYLLKFRSLNDQNLWILIFKAIVSFCCFDFMMLLYEVIFYYIGFPELGHLFGLKFSFFSGHQ